MEGLITERPDVAPLLAVSLFAGIGGLDLGFKEAGIEVRWACENEPRARALLARKFPEIILYPDVKGLTGEQLRAGGADGARLVVLAGFPCQDLSMAGSRRGLGGARSGLFFEVVRLAGELRAQWVVLENVPGLLTSTCACTGRGECVANGRAVRCGRWASRPKRFIPDEPHTVDGGACAGGCMARHGGAMGVVVGALAGLGYGYAWRVLDAQHFGVPQRRDRVFIVGCLGDWAAPVEILLEPEVGGGHPAKGGKARARAAARPRARAQRRGSGRRDRTARPATTAYDPSVGDVEGPANTLQRATWPLMITGDPEVTRTLGTRDGGEIGIPLIPVGETASGLVALGQPGGPAYPVRSNGPSHTSGSLVATPLGTKDRGGGRDGGIPIIPITADALRGEGAARTPSPDGAGGSSLRDPALGIGKDGDPAGPIMAGSPGAVAAGIQWRGGSTQDAIVGEDGTSPALAFSGSHHDGHHEPKLITETLLVRRFTPKECERLQGFPDGWTAGQADSVRYRQLGNAVAVPVAAWIGRRLADADRRLNEIVRPSSP